MCKNRCVNRDELSEAGAHAGGRKRERRRAAAATKAVHRRQRAAAIERLQRAAQRRGQRRQATVITGVKRDKLGASGGAVERTHMCNKTWRCRVNSGLMIVRPGGSQGHDFGNQSSSWVAQLLSQLLHNETCRNYWSGRQWEQDCLQKLLGDTHLPSVSRLLHEGAAQWKPVTGPSGKVCVLPAAAVMPWVNRIMPSSSSAASIAIPSPEIMTNALRSTWTLNQPLPLPPTCSRCAPLPCAATRWSLQNSLKAHRSTHWLRPFAMQPTAILQNQKRLAPARKHCLIGS